MSVVEKPSAAWTPLQRAGAALMWVWVLVPFGWGFFELFKQIGALFG